MNILNCFKTRDNTAETEMNDYTHLAGNDEEKGEIEVNGNTRPVSDLTADEARSLGQTAVKSALLFAVVTLGCVAYLTYDHRIHGVNVQPSFRPTMSPTNMPTYIPTEAPTTAPTEKPTFVPFTAPTPVPTQAPTTKPTHHHKPN